MLESLKLKPVKIMKSAWYMILVRHWNTKLNSDGKLRAFIDVPLDDTGFKQAHDVGNKLKGRKIDMIFTSDFIRAQQTADVISKITWAPIMWKTFSLRPWNLGKYAGKDIKESLPVLAEYAEHKPDEKIPDWESFNTFKKRFFTFIHALKLKYPWKNIVIVAHHRNDRMMHGWEKKWMNDDFDIDIETFLQKGIEPWTHRVIWK